MAVLQLTLALLASGGCEAFIGSSWFGNALQDATNRAARDLPASKTPVSTPTMTIPWSWNLPKWGDSTPMPDIRTYEGVCRVRGQRMWYKICYTENDDLKALSRGNKKFPVVVAHGGPRLPHYYLEPLQALCTSEGGGRPVVFFDQIGCGNSDSAPDPSFYSVKGLRDDLLTLLWHLNVHHGLKGFHMLGHSWGGCLALEAVMSGKLPVATDLASLVLAATPTSARVALRERQGMMDAMAQEGETQAAALRRFEQRHWCKVDPLPQCLQTARLKSGGMLQGLDTVNNWDLGDRLAGNYPTGTPCLVIRGDDDFVSERCTRAFSKGIRNLKTSVLLGCSHMAHLEEPEQFVSNVGSFFSEAEGARLMLKGCRLSI